jgi:prefoldin subunit 5
MLLRFRSLIRSREKVIQKLRELRDDIQEEDRRHNIGKIAYSSTGIISGGLTIAGIAASPFTFGVSLGLTIAGAATGAATGIAGVSHGIAAHVFIKNKCKDAEELLQKHKSEMESIKKCIEDSFPAVNTTIRGGGVVCNITAIVLKSTKLASRGAQAADCVAGTVKAIVPKFLTVAGGVAAGITIVISIGTIFNSGKKIANNDMHDAVVALNKVIEDLENELEDLKMNYKTYSTSFQKYFTRHDLQSFKS